MRGFARLLPVLVALVTLSSTPVLAHGGDLVYTGAAGPYQVRAFANWAEGWLDYSVDLRNVSTGARIPGAEVRVTVFENGVNIAQYTAFESGSVYEFVEQSPEEVHWNLVLDISSALGPAKLSHSLDLAPTNWVWPSVLVIGGFFAAVAAHTWTARRRARA
ncbi:MAG: hypothetical protein OXO54_03145 [Chloroflexota bacterium]|nr:hypothetical protein [Chloroflexota bacterium]MDE2897300.1 hypothetical protein [Chloroflexota bacterium]